MGQQHNYLKPALDYFHIFTEPFKSLWSFEMKLLLIKIAVLKTNLSFLQNFFAINHLQWFHADDMTL